MYFTQTATLTQWICSSPDVNATETVMPTQEDIIDEDIQWMKQVAHGDENALRQLIEKWQKPLINFFYRSTNSVELSEDLAQMTFIKLYRAAPKYEPTAKFSTFLFHIGRRLLINEYRRQSRKPLEVVDPSDLGGSSVENDEIEVYEIEEAFNHALEALPENQRTAIVLLKQQELSYEEIADIMGASESAVKSWIYRARQKLKTSLKDFHENRS